MIDKQIRLNLAGKKVFISGGTRGLGLAIAKSLLGAGADVSFCGRNNGEVASVEKDLKSFNKLNSRQEVLGLTADVGEFNQIKMLKDELQMKFGKIDILVCNAGVLGPISQFLESDLDEWKLALNTNLLGSIFLIHELLPAMIENGSGKIIQLSGGGAASPLPGLTSYAASKAGIIRFIETLAEEYKDSGVDINAIAPGMLKTRMLREMLDAGPDVLGSQLFSKSVAKAAEETDSTKQACELVNFLASDESDGITGKLISAEWDNWREWPNHIQQLRESDLYTLRRIAGRDRGQTWGDS